MESAIQSAMFDLHNKVIKVVVATVIFIPVMSNSVAMATAAGKTVIKKGDGKNQVHTRLWTSGPSKKGSSSSSYSSKKDVQDEISAIDKKRKEIHARIAGARQKEKLAYVKLSEITHKLHATQGTLNHSKKQLQTTVSNIHNTETVINQTQTAEQKHEGLAGGRLREIYEGHRLSFLEMAFQVDSLETLIDRVYFQERIASLDRGLIDQLRAKKQALQDNKNRLDQEKNKLGDFVSDIVKKTMEITRLRVSQEQVAENLKTQRAFFEQAERDLAVQSKALEKQILTMETSSVNSSGKPMQKGTGTMAMPLRAKVTSPFGWRTHPIFKRRKFHTGIDLAGPRRSPIRASDSGHVLFTGWMGGYGKVVIVSHGRNISTLYAHLSTFAVNKGDNLAKGDIVGYEGATGFATGPHLHFEVRVEGKPNNPLNYVN
ncbi:MAG: peptidoglycan DD-metalloendopeptidase family protein [Candidatus Melainabacteria bacterium]|nr:peptidoglycan DD-metalloendopeptidase family protein [Candidatus Melainabacteria bacterium]